MTQYGYPPGQGQPYPGQQPQQPHPGQQPQQPHPGQQQQQPGAGLPQVYLPDEAAVNAAYQKAREAQARAAAAKSGQGFGDAKFFQPLGPNGETKWESVPIGYEASYIFWLMPSATPGAMPYVEDHSHFYRPPDSQGAGLTCTGDQCWFCVSRNMMFKTGREDDAKRARDQGRVQRRALYQILLLEHPQSHVDATTGKMVPWIFRAPGGLHNDIVAKLQARSPVRILDTQAGRPLVMTKRKKGKEKFDIEWKLEDLDPHPLDPWYYPAFQNLWDLQKFVKPPSLADQLQAIQQLGFPIPQELPALVQQEQAQSSQVQGAPQPAGQPAYQPYGAPPHASPYSAPGVPPGGAPPQAQPGGAPGAPYPPQPGYPPQQGGYPPQGGGYPAPPNQQGGYPQGGGYPPQQGQQQGGGVPPHLTQQMRGS